MEVSSYFMGLMTEAPVSLVCHPYRYRCMPAATETSLLDGLPRTERALGAGIGTSQALEIITQQPWVVGMGLARIPSGSLGYGIPGWEASQGHLKPPHTPHPQRLLEVGMAPSASPRTTRGHRERAFFWERSWVPSEPLGHVGRGC